ncbi:hypothetical protein TNCV_3943621 [Trichonephila clavipes]|nr:hypothetical protein TNCV_3943621 [Trichonephila clavipes]
MDRECPHELFKFLHYLNVGTICVTDQHSKQTFKDIQASWSSSSPFKRTPVMLLNANGRDLGQCPFCNQTTCHRWIAVQGIVQARERIQAQRCLVGENLQRNVEKSRSTPEKYRQEDGVHLQQHVLSEKRLYVWISNGKVGRDSPDSNDPRAHADL